MSRWCFLLLGLLTLFALRVDSLHAQTRAGAIHLLEIRGVINPPVASYVERALRNAHEQDARLVVIQLDTPGGLDTSMRAINQTILASPVPVAVYVTPPGARAASAGLFILMASHLAANRRRASGRYRRRCHGSGARREN